MKLLLDTSYQLIIAMHIYVYYIACRYEYITYSIMFLFICMGIHVVELMNGSGLNWFYSCHAFLAKGILFVYNFLLTTVSRKINSKLYCVGSSLINFVVFPCNSMPHYNYIYFA